MADGVEVFITARELLALSDEEEDAAPALQSTPLAATEEGTS